MPQLRSPHVAGGKYLLHDTFLLRVRVGRRTGRQTNFTMAELAANLSNVISGNYKWVFVGGKGGVGKTTTSCSLAVALAGARPGKTVCLISTDPAHNLSDAFGQKFSREPTAVNGVPGLDAMEVEPPSAESAVAMSDGSTPGSGAGPEASLAAMSELTSAIPGIDEAVSFGALMQSVQSMQYDTVVFDTAPTGHTLRLLGFPKLLDIALDKLTDLHARLGPMFNAGLAAMGMNPGAEGAEPLDAAARLAELSTVVKQVVAQFRDASATTFVAVCIPEFLSVYETERLSQELSKLGIVCNNIVVNQLIPANPDSAASAQLYTARLAIQRKYLEQMRELYSDDFHITPLPLLASEVRGSDALRSFAKRVTGEVAVDFGLPATDLNPSLMNVMSQTGLVWTFVGGKGGVGKTTLSAALAVALAADAAARSAKVLVVSTDPAHNLSDAFGVKISPDAKPTAVAGFDNLFAMEVDAATVTEEFFANLSASSEESAALRNSPLGALLPDTSDIGSLAKNVPGIDEAVSFSSIMRLVRSMDFERVVFDMAPTGHALRLLGLPDTLEKLLSKLSDLKNQMAPMMSMFASAAGADANGLGGQGVMDQLGERLESLQADVREVAATLSDAEKSTFVAVAIAEFLSVYETERLVQELANMGMDVRNVVVNQLMPPTEAVEDRMAILRARAKMQAGYVEQIEELYPPDDFHVTRVPMLLQEVRGVDALRAFATRLTS